MNKHVHIIVFDFAANTFAAGIAFGGGRINKTNNSYEINYFITDHLGSTRVIVDNAGNITAQYNYYPFGKQWEDANLMANTNRYIFSGKEKQTVRDLGWLDFSARMYANYEMPIFTTQDPLAEKYYSISPYAYCFNNPIKYIDPTGMYIEESSQREWDRQRNSVTRERDKLQNKVDNFTAKAEAKGWSAEKLASKIGNSADRVSSLNNTIVQN